MGGFRGGTKEENLLPGFYPRFLVFDMPLGKEVERGNKSRQAGFYESGILGCQALEDAKA